ncbi:MAG: CoA transferase [Thermomicrobiales bacterium]
MTPLRGIRVLTLAFNVPGPVAAARLTALGATVTKIEPPGGDPLARATPAWYAALTAGQEIVRLDLKDAGERAMLDDLLVPTDLLLTASRPAALARLALDWTRLHARYPRLSQVAIVGHAPPDEERPGHDLTYLAHAGLLNPPMVPRTLFADLAGAERAVSAALALLLGRERGAAPAYEIVALADVAEELAAPLRHGLTEPEGSLGGGEARYTLYHTQEGWLAVAALEPHFRDRLAHELGVEQLDRAALQALFRTRTAAEWEEWGEARDLPLAAVRGAVSTELLPSPSPNGPHKGRSQKAMAPYERGRG